MRARRSSSKKSNRKPVRPPSLCETFLLSFLFQFALSNSRSDLLHVSRLIFFAEGKGWFSNLSVGLSSALNEVSAGVSKVGSSLGGSAHETVTNQLEKDFRASFGLPGTERLWDGFSCRCINGPAAVEGWLYISSNYASFFSRSGEHVIAFIIPLRNIVSIQKAHATKPPNAAIAPQLTIAPNGGPLPSTPGAVLPDSLQIFTLDGTVHSFFSFWSYLDCYNVLDRAWRQSFQAAAVAPMGVQQGYGQPVQQPYPAPGM